MFDPHHSPGNMGKQYEIKKPNILPNPAVCCEEKIDLGKIDERKMGNDRVVCKISISNSRWMP